MGSTPRRPSGSVVPLFSARRGSDVSVFDIEMPARSKPASQVGWITQALERRCNDLFPHARAGGGVPPERLGRPR